MTTSRSGEIQGASPLPARQQTETAWYRRVSAMFVRDTAPSESVATHVHLHARPDLVWRRILFYEEVPGRAPFPLRAVLPRPVRTDGDKTRAGSQIHCIYSRGSMVKRITAVEPRRLLQFDVVEQNLGIEDYVLAQSGSYTLLPCGEGTDVVLVTNYFAFLHPRRLWRPLEAFLARQLHRHILAAVRTTLSPGGLACTTSPSRSRR